jgi:four helix bundle protein
MSSATKESLTWPLRLDMKPQFRFEKLTVWQEARSLNRSVYQVTRHFPKEELFAVTSQIRRAAVSISANIAEGSGRNSDRDFAHFLEQAYGSLMELAALFYLALDVGYVSPDESAGLLSDVEKLAKGLASLNRSLHVEQSKTPFPRSL